MHAKAPEKTFASKKNDVFDLDDTWSVDIWDLNDYGPKSVEDHSWFLVENDNFRKFWRTVPLKIEIAQTIKDFFENMIVCLWENQMCLRLMIKKSFQTNSSIIFRD